MVCKACNTRLGANDRFCPNCGRTASPGTSLSGAAPLSIESADPSLSQGETTPLPPPVEVAQGAVPESEELDLSEEVELEVAAAEAPPAKRSAAPRREAPAPRPVEPARPAPPPPAPKSRPAPAASPAVSSPFTLHAEELRARIAERPEMVERGLSIYRDPQSGRPTGVGFATEVGEVDLLALDESGALVLVVVAERAAGDPVPSVLERVGWVSKHVARPDQTVRAIALLEPPPPALGYSARAVAETVAFKTWRVAVAVEDVEI